MMIVIIDYSCSMIVCFSNNHLNIHGTGYNYTHNYGYKFNIELQLLIINLLRM